MTTQSKIAPLLILLSLSLNSFSFASHAESHSQENQSHQNHSQNHHHQMQMAKSPLTEAGNDVFGTIQEVIAKLNADPNTDWNKVNIEALRSHLVDMYEMTINVNIISQKPVKNGLRVKMQAIGNRASAALKRVFSAHPMMLEQETGWKMSVEMNNNEYTLTITSNKLEDVDKIRGLGYIGLMAYGNHHQPHHWSMAKGSNPHSHH